MSATEIAAIVLGLIALFLIIVVVKSFKIVRPYQRGIVEQLGKYKSTVDPGLRMILPFIQTMRLVDMREQVVDVPPQEVITADNVVVTQGTAHLWGAVTSEAEKRAAEMAASEVDGVQAVENHLNVMPQSITAGGL